MKERTLLLIRHPQTVANTDGRFVGRENSPLTEYGREQAGRLVQEIVEFAPDAIWSSPLERARVVAESAAQELGLEVRFDERLQELSFGDAEGLTYDEARERGVPVNYRSQDRPVARGGESRADLSSRSASVVGEALLTAHRPVIVTHGGVVRAAIAHLLRLDLDALWRFDIQNGQLVTIRQIDGYSVLEEFRRV